MISRRVFLKNGGLALVSLGFAPEFLKRVKLLAEEPLEHDRPFRRA